MATQDVKTAYDNAKNDIANLLGFFECELSKEPEKLNWGHVGSLQKIRGDLVSTLAFLSGFSEDEINDTLIETRVDANARTENTNPHAKG